MNKSNDSITCTGVGIMVLLALIIAGLVYKQLTRQEDDNGKTLRFAGCAIPYPHYDSGALELYEGHSVTNEMEYEAAHRKLALCLCENYLKTQDSTVAAKLLDLYRQYGRLKEENFTTVDSLLKHRRAIFDPNIYID